MSDLAPDFMDLDQTHQHQQFPSTSMLKTCWILEILMIFILTFALAKVPFAEVHVTEHNSYDGCV